jgi:CheY-like chemotaxis protein
MSLQGIRVFYIEDDLKNRAIVQTILEVSGCVFDYEPWGFPEIALRKIARFRPNIVLLDLKFAHQATGYDVFAAIRRHPQFQAIPIVAVSAADPAEAIPKTRELGFAGFIAKPVNLRQFPRQLEAVLAGETVWSAGE